MGRGFLSGVFWSGLLLIAGLGTASLLGPPPRGPQPIVDSAAPQAAPQAARPGDVAAARPGAQGTPDSPARQGAGRVPGTAPRNEPPLPGDLGRLQDSAAAPARPGAVTEAPAGTIATGQEPATGTGLARLGSDAPALPDDAAQPPATPGADSLPQVEKTLGRPVTAEVDAEGPGQLAISEGAGAGAPATPLAGRGEGAGTDAPDLPRGPDTLAAAPASPAGPVVEGSAAAPRTAQGAQALDAAGLGDADRPATPRRADPTAPVVAGAGAESMAQPPRDSAPGPVPSPGRPESAPADDSTDPEGLTTPDRLAAARPAPPAGVTAEYAPLEGPRPLARPETVPDTAADDLDVTARLDPDAAATEDLNQEDTRIPAAPAEATTDTPRSERAVTPRATTPRIIRPRGENRPLLQGEARAAAEAASTPDDAASEKAARSAALNADRARELPGLAVPTPDDSRSQDLPPVERFAVRHSDTAGRPLMSVVLIDLPGQGLTPAQLSALTFPVTFAIDPSREDAARVAAAYRAAGHEVLMLAQGLARAGGPDAAPGLIDKYASRLPEAVGLMDVQAGGIQADRALQARVIDELARRGYGFLLYDRGLNSAAAAARREGVPTGLIFRMLDGGQERAEVIRRYLDRAAFKAGKDGSVVMVGHTYPETVQGLVSWALDGRAAALSLAPVTAIMFQGDGERG
ncbi:hypothetical protein BV394_02785 [Brevirhabdus pacifica]|uniref:Uncharacterized protein n=1 Tax=Brevirhabdus pacifica TaxID=1267768 RepID=A0A1U7DFL6_9RHOB|nr:divergent polysaccharide deacetylase family protein [Brevirhabdus pacifica]APX88787.1 hypothetical protein BV394_02785 [Brevirhabdus pacifica]PJJ86684.1 polysaccharide deacetylase 2 family uncharacterized protein YibQ [Brevirhabdus pacifica]